MATTVSAITVGTTIAGAPSVTVPGGLGLSTLFSGATAANTAIVTAAGGVPLTSLPSGDIFAILAIPAGETETLNLSFPAGDTVPVTLVFSGAGNYTGTITGLPAGSKFVIAGTGDNTFGIAGSVDVIDPGNNALTFTSGAPTLIAATGSNDQIFVGDANLAMTAQGAATVGVQFQQNSGGTLNFVNNSNDAATVYTGAYTAAGGGNIYADNAVTAFGGAGGGFYVGGLAGNNSLVGGTGVVTLVGGGNNDFLEAGSSVGTNVLFGGPGTETLIGASTSGANDFNLGLNYVGIGSIAGTDVVSTSGTGTQDFAIGAGSFTITGSDAVSSVNAFANVYDVIRDASLSGAALTITNFAAKDIILLTDNTETAGSSVFNSISTDHFGGTQITLSDHTTIDLVGIAATSLTTVAGAHGIIGVVLK